MKDFRIAMAQINMPQSNTVDQNIEKMHTWIRKSADNGADMIMFDELSVSGYLLNSSGLAGPGSGKRQARRATRQRLQEVLRNPGY